MFSSFKFRKHFWSLEVQKNMGISLCSLITLLAFLLCFSISPATSNSLISKNFLKCFHLKSNLSNSINSNGIVFTKNTSSYLSLLQSSARNLRFSTTSTPKPELIIRPTQESHIQSSVVCSKKTGLTIRVRSGGHDYEGLSYVSDTPFIIVDLSNLRSIKIDAKSKTAWVESGATIGELYYNIANESNVYGFPAGSCPTVGVGGHFSGGGFGTIFRKYGLAADNVIDAKIVRETGRIVDRKSMGEDLFWAIRGGGGASFGIVFAWKINLVPVPSTVTVFEIQKTLENGATKLLHKWQYVADKLAKSLFLHVTIGVVDNNAGRKSNKTVAVSFGALFLGRVEELVRMIDESFPELGVKRNDCTEMSWIESVLYFAGFSKGEAHHVLLNRTQGFKSFFKAKSDYVKEPVSKTGLEGLWKVVLEEENALLILTPYGGRMSEISESKIPFPHRNGNLYKIQYMVTWETEKETEKHIDWIRRVYGFMTHFVSENPRCAYVNYRDLDLGINKMGYGNYAQASVWGLKYFKNNFKRLAQIKAKVDPSNFFRDEQSIPLFVSPGKGN